MSSLIWHQAFFDDADNWVDLFDSLSRQRKQFRTSFVGLHHRKSRQWTFFSTRFLFAEKLRTLPEIPQRMTGKEILPLRSVLPLRLLDDTVYHFHDGSFLLMPLYWLYRRFLCRLSKKFEKNSRNFVFPPWRNGTFELKNQRLTIDKKLSGCMREKSGIRDGCRYGSIRLSLIMPWIAS